MASSTLTSAARGVAQVVSPVIIIIIVMNMDLSISYTPPPPRLTENRESLSEIFFCNNSLYVKIN